MTQTLISQESTPQKSILTLDLAFPWIVLICNTLYITACGIVFISLRVCQVSIGSSELGMSKIPHCSVEIIATISKQLQAFNMMLAFGGIFIWLSIYILGAVCIKLVTSEYRGNIVFRIFSLVYASPLALIALFLLFGFITK